MSVCFRLILFLLTDTYSLLFFSRKLATGRLQFQVVDTTEIQFTSFLGVLVTVIFGYSFWDIVIPVPWTEMSLTVRSVFAPLGAFPLLSNSVVQIYQQLTSSQRSNVYYVLTQCAFIWAASFAIFSLVPGAKANCMMYFVLLAGMFSKLITETVFVSTGTAPPRSWLRTEHLAPLLVLANVWLPLLSAPLAVILGAVLTVSLWVIYFAFVVYKSASYLNLPIFTVPPSVINKKN